MPVSDAGVGLERKSFNVIRNTALNVQHAGAKLTFTTALGGVDRIHFAVVPLEALIVIVSDKRAPPLAERNRAVLVVEVRLVLINKVLGP